MSCQSIDEQFPSPSRSAARISAPPTSSPVREARETGSSCSPSSCAPRSGWGSGTAFAVATGPLHLVPSSSALGSRFVTTAQSDLANMQGPLVWLDMDQRQLDDAYDHTRYAPNREHVLGRYLTNSAA